MKFPLSWLQEYIDPGMTPIEIGKALTLAGLEVDAIDTLAASFSGVVIGRVTHVEKHPNADKLCVAQVSIGPETFQVVCGAPNCRVGLKTAFAQVGAILCDSSGECFTVKKTKIRGVESSGMLCSALELQIGEESDKILELNEKLIENSDLAALYADTLFDVSLTPNLGHCANIIGIARELSAVTGKPISLPLIYAEETSAVPIVSKVHVKIEDPKGCPRYACRLIEGVKMGTSPDWMQKRLIACGLRPINNIVDITNYVVMEMGHPMHAFDYDTLAGHSIIVRTALDDENFTTLDGKEYTLSAGDLLICDNTKPVALAGIMGGQNSEVSNTTQNVLLEAAYFHPGTIRKTSKRLGLSTDASKRFERQCDPNALIKVLDRTAMLIQELAGGQIALGILDIKNETFAEKKIDCRLNRINHVLGTQLGLSEVENIFQRLGLPYRWDGQERFIVSVPTYRADIKEEIDLIEEVARIFGYDNISRPSSLYHMSQLPHTPMFLFEREVRSRLIGEGLQEFLTCDLIGPSLLNIVNDKAMPEESVVHVLNPTSIEQSVLRTSLMPGLLQLVKYNIDHQNHDVHGFEIGRVHFKEGENYKEQSVVGIVLTGKNAPSTWDFKSHNNDFFDLKGILENLLSELDIDNVTFRPSHYPTLHSGRQASIFVNDLELGSLGEVHPAIQRRLDVPQRIMIAELSLHDLAQVRVQDKKMSPLPIYPSSERDWTVTISENIPFHQIIASIKKINAPLLKEVSLLDIYKSAKLPAGVHNMTFHFVYRDDSKTIEQEAVESEHQRIISEVSRLIIPASS